MMQCAAPAFSSAIKRRLRSPEKIAALLEVFDDVLALAGPEASDVHREEGVSFNPRPARVGQLVLSELADAEPVVLEAALLSTVPAPLLETSDLAKRDGASLAIEAQRFAAVPDSSHPLEVQVIALALAVDTVRHLHMSRQPPAEREEDLARAESVLRAVDAPGLRLASLLEAGISRYRRLFDRCDR